MNDYSQLVMNIMNHQILHAANVMLSIVELNPVMRATHRHVILLEVNALMKIAKTMEDAKGDEVLLDVEHAMFMGAYNAMASRLEELNMWEGIEGVTE